LSPLDNQTGCEESVTVSESDPEVKKISSLTTEVKIFADLLERIQYFSDWHKAKGAVAFCLRLQREFKKNRQDNKTATPDRRIGHLAPVSVEELRVAEVEIIKAVQREAFPKGVALPR